MEKYIIDTNFFFNLEIKSGLGESPKEIIINLTKIIKKLNPASAGEKKAEFFMPPRVLDEFLTFVDKEEGFIKDFLSLISVKSPNNAKIDFPSSVFYKLVDEIRERSYKGLRIAEEVVDQAGQKMIGQNNLSKIEYQKTIGDIVTKLRERYRQATRFNFLDSVADLDLIVLSKELDGFLISSDEGVLTWGRIFGIKEVAASLFHSRLLSQLAD